jgi:hypothetical protein
MGKHVVKRPHGTCQSCNLAGCDKPVAFNLRTGRVHDFCSKEHADRAIRSGAWVRPVRDQYRHYHGGKQKMAAGADAGHICKLPSCDLPVFRDTRTGRKFDYCGRSHAVEHRLALERNNNANQASTLTTTAAVAGGGTVELLAGGAIISAGPTIGHVTTSPFIYDGWAIGKSTPSVSSSDATAKMSNLSKAPLVKKPLGKMPPASGNLTTGVAKKLPPPVATTSSSSAIPMNSRSVPRKLPPPSVAATAGASAAAPTKPSPAITHPQCTVCLGRNANIILIPCGHVCLCQEDAEKLKAKKAA